MLADLPPFDAFRLNWHGPTDSTVNQVIVAPSALVVTIPTVGRYPTVGPTPA